MGTSESERSHSVLQSIILARRKLQLDAVLLYLPTRRVDRVNIFRKNTYVPIFKYIDIYFLLVFDGTPGSIEWIV